VCEALFYTFGQTFEDYFEIKIENQRGGLSPVEVQNILQIYQMGLMSKELAIRKLNPNMTEQELQEELANIDIDKQLQMQEQMESPSMVSPQDTAGGVEQGNTLNE
jgi:RNA recognition motif-containing protein